MNKSNSILLVDPNFNLNQSAPCTLVIKIGIDSISYAIIDNELQKVCVLYDEQECTNVIMRFKERLASDSYLKLNFVETIVSAYGANDIQIPDSLFNDQTVALHQKILAEKPHLEVYLYHQQSFKYTHIFTIDKDLDLLLEDNFNNISRIPYQASIIATHKDDVNNSILIDCTVNAFTITVLDNQQLQFQKSYQTANLEEFQYYILLTINMLNIDSTKINVKLSGIIHPDDSKFTCLDRYFERISFNDIQSNLDLKMVKHMPLHYYTNLLNQTACV